MGTDLEGTHDVEVIKEMQPDVGTHLALDNAFAKDDDCYEEQPDVVTSPSCPTLSPRPTRVQTLNTPACRSRLLPQKYSLKLFQRIQHQHHRMMRVVVVGVVVAVVVPPGVCHRQHRKTRRGLDSSAN